MSSYVDLVRFRNDGDQFHYVWTARRAMRLLDPKSGLVAVGVEGVSEDEENTSKPASGGLLVVDTSEYYGSVNLNSATQVIYNQLKYSTTNPSGNWTLSGVKDSLKGFADRYVGLCEKHGKISVRDKVKFRFVTNRPISPDLLKTFEAATQNTPPHALSKKIKKIRKQLLSATRLKVSDFNEFASLVDFLGDEKSLDIQEQLLDAEHHSHAVYLDTYATTSLKALVHSKALSSSSGANVIDLDAVLATFRVVKEELFPAPPKFERIENPIHRSIEANLVEEIVSSASPTIISAAGGAGKSVLAQQLGGYLPEGSETILFDGFAGGDYRNPRLYRHRCSHGLVQIANEMAQRGLCDILLPQPHATDQQYLQAFRTRFEQAAAVVRNRSADARLLVIIDAADNLGMAAIDAGDNSFVPALITEAAPQNASLVCLARGHRIEEHIKPNKIVSSVSLPDFSERESGVLLRRKFSEATDQDVSHFHRFTDKNPRVQANALAEAKSLDQLKNSLGPQIQTVDTLLSDQLERALKTVTETQAGSKDELRPLLTILSVLPPPIPLEVASSATGFSTEAIRSFISDFANGRPIHIRGNFLQFRDEPVETWFHDKFAASQAELLPIIEILTPNLGQTPYVASVLPMLLHNAGEYKALNDLALGGEEPATSDPIERRAILFQRVQYALKASLNARRYSDATKLLLRAGEEVSASDRQSDFLTENCDLVSEVAGEEVVSDFIYRNQMWRVSGKRYAHCAVMLSANSANLIEAEKFLRLGISWLNSWFRDQPDENDDNRHTEREKIEIEDIATFGEAIINVHGIEDFVQFMSHWRDWAAFQSTRIVARRLVELDKEDLAVEVFSAAHERMAIQLALITEINSICQSLPRSKIRKTIELIEAEYPHLAGKEDFFRQEFNLGMIAIAEQAARAKTPKYVVRDLLSKIDIQHDHTIHHFDRGESREILMRKTSLEAALQNKSPDISTIVPSAVEKLLGDKNAEHQREVREFRAIYGSLLPSYAARAQAIVNPADRNVPIGNVESICSLKGDTAYVGPETQIILGENVCNWFEALLWNNQASKKTTVSLTDWLVNQRQPISIPTWVSLARLAALHSERVGDGALLFAQNAREVLENIHEDASSSAESFASVARALAPYSKAEAAAYFDQALDYLNRLGNELHERLFSLLAISDASADPAASCEQEAFRVARVGEVFNEYNGHKFPWSDVAKSLAKLSPASSLAIASRWNDRGAEHISRLLPEIAIHFLETRGISPTVAASLHAIGGYWNLQTTADLFFTQQLSKARKQKILDFLVWDHEFDPNSEEGSLARLSEIADNFSLEQSQIQKILKCQIVRPSDRSYSSSISKRSARKNKSSPTKFRKLLGKLDLTTPDGVDEAIKVHRGSNTSSDWNEFLALLRELVPDNPEARTQHLYALASSDELMAVVALDAIEGCATEWRSSLAVKNKLRGISETFVDHRAEEIANSRWSFEQSIDRLAALSDLRSEDILNFIMQTISRQCENFSGGSLFFLAGAIATHLLDPVEARAALNYALDRLEPILKDEDGDGPWSEKFIPPQTISEGIASLIYALLAAPLAAERWRAAHTVRKLCEVREESIIGFLVDRLQSDELPAFTDSELPFYSLHARLYLLVAFARVSKARKPPPILLERFDVFKELATSGLPHILIRHFAAETALNLLGHSPQLATKATKSDIENANASAFPARQYDRSEIQETYEDVEHSPSPRFFLDYDFDRYWLGNLSRAFNAPHSEVRKKLERWILTEWNAPDDFTAWNADPRARRNLLREGSYASHGSYPEIDRNSFYLTYHAMFCVAGELLQEYAPALEYGQNAVDEWVSRHLLTRPDGYWLSDRRDFNPLEPRKWQKDKQDWGRRDEWPFSVEASDFDSAIELQSSTPEAVVLWGTWNVSDGSRKERIDISSALAPVKSSGALLRSLQTTDDIFGTFLPTEDPKDTMLPDEFRLCGWIVENQESLRLDEFDPFGGCIPWPGPQPGKKIRKIQQLKGRNDGRAYIGTDDSSLFVEIWGDHRPDRRPRVQRALNRGARIRVETQTCLKLLKKLDQCLIIRVEIERENEHEEIKEIDYANRRYTRFYKLASNGRLDTLYRYRRIRKQHNR